MTEEGEPCEREERPRWRDPDRTCKGPGAPGAAGRQVWLAGAPLRAWGSRGGVEEAGQGSWAVARTGLLGSRGSDLPSFKGWALPVSEKNVSYAFSAVWQLEQNAEEG